MAYTNMDVAPVKDGGEKGFGFEYSESLSSAGNGVTVLIPDDIQNVTVHVLPAGGASGKVQFTLSDVSIVKIGIGINWIDWDAGLVSSSETDVLFPVTAIRVVQSGAGTVDLEVRAQ